MEALKTMNKKCLQYTNFKEHSVNHKSNCLKFAVDKKSELLYIVAHKRCKAETNRYILFQASK